VLAVVVSLWVNLAVQPCAMAMGADSDCPHCPPAVEDTIAMAHGHHGSGADADCATSGSDCGAIDEFGIDSRSSQSKLKDNAEDVVPVSVLPGGRLLVPATIPMAATGPPDIAVAPLPLHLLNCVFLD
jgi:hypothetical protein